MSADTLRDPDDTFDLLTRATIDLLRAYGLNRTAVQQLMTQRIADLWPESVPPAHPTIQ